MGTIGYQSVSGIHPSLDDILGAPRQLTSVSFSNVTYEVTSGPWAGCRISYIGMNLMWGTNIPDPSGMVRQFSIVWNSQTLFSFSYASVFAAFSASNGVDGALNHLQGSTYGGANTFIGSAGNDRLTTYRTGDTLNGGAGDDRLWGRIGGTFLNGEAGDDVFVATTSGLSVHGSIDDEQGLVETDILEVQGLEISFNAITNVDVLRFGNDGGFVNRSVVLSADQIGDGLLSKTLHVESSVGVANRIAIGRPGDGGAVQLDLSGWTFDAGWAGTAFRVEVILGENSPADDTVTGTVKDDLISVGNGSNVVRGGLGADRLSTGNGDDVFIYGAGEAANGERIQAGDGTDTIEVRGDNDFSGMQIDGIERLRFAGAADAVIDARVGPIEIIGDAHANRLSIVLPTATRFDLNDWSFSNWDEADILNIQGSSGNDEIILRANLLGSASAGAGDDTLLGGGGADRLEGGKGADSLDGGDGIDTAVFSGRRGDYARTLNTDGSLALADGRMGADGTDTLRNVEIFQFADGSITLAELLNNTPTGVSLSDGLIDENSDPRAPVGTLSVADQGDAGPHTYTLLSDAGGRFLLDEAQVLYTGNGSLDFEQAENYTIRVRATDSHGAAIEKDLVIVVGDVMNESARGTAQADVMWGGTGRDAFNGLAGNDVLQGGAGRDSLTGGTGRDVFVFGNGDTGTSKASADLITDFSGKGGDRINLKAIDADVKKKGDQAFSFIGEKAFTKAGQVRYEKTKKETYVYLNTDNDKGAEAVIKLKGAIDLQKSWFVL